MKHKTLDLNLDIKSLTEAGRFTGYASVFGNIDHVGDIIAAGAFTKTLSKWSKKKNLPPLLWQHNQSEPLGFISRLEEDKTGLLLEGELLIQTDPLALKAYGLLRSGGISALSIGYITDDFSFDQKTDVTTIHTLELFEVSIVSIPANPEAIITSVKSAFQKGDIPTKTQLEKALRNIMSIKQAKSLIAGGYSYLDHRKADRGIKEKLNNLINILRK